MSRATVVVNRDAFTQLINSLENENTFSSRSELFDTITTKYNEMHPNATITKSITILRINEWKIELKTPKGKRGRGKQPIFIDQAKFINLIEDLENKNTYNTRTALYQDIQKNWEAKLEISTIIQRIKLWEIDLKTEAGKKGKTAKNIDREILTSIVNDLEETEQFTNRSILFEEVATAYESLTGEKISAALVYLRINEWQIDLKTPKGQKGRAPGQKLSDEHKNALIAGRKKEKSYNANYDEMFKRTPERYHRLIELTKTGNRRAAIKLNCLNCTAFSVKEVRNCSSDACAFYGIRPFQKKSDLPIIEAA